MMTYMVTEINREKQYYYTKIGSIQLWTGMFYKYIDFWASTCCSVWYFNKMVFQQY